MNEFIDKLLERPRHQKIGILAGILAVLLMLDFFYLYSPMAEQISRVTEEIENARKQRDIKRKQAANQEKLQKDLREWDALLKEAVAQLPDRKEIPDLLSSISNKAREAGLAILLFRPRAETYQEFYAEIPVDVLVRGSFYNAVTFFDEVGRLNRLVNVHNISISKAPKSDGERVVLETSAVATTFRFLSEAERKKIAEEKAKAAKK